MMTDIRIAVGAKKVFSKIGGSLLKGFRGVENFGEADRVTIHRDYTTISTLPGFAFGVKERIRLLEDERKEKSNEEDRSFIDERIAMLSSGVGYINIGGATEAEKRSRYDTVEDSVRAAQSAFEKGVVPGGGWTFRHAFMDAVKTFSEDELSEMDSMAMEMMAAASYAPFHSIIENAWLDPNAYSLTKGVYNILTGSYEDPGETTIKKHNSNY